MVKKMFMGSLLLVFIIGCHCINEEKVINHVDTDKTVEKAVWNAKLLTAEYEKLAVLTEGDELHFHHNSTKEAVSFFMSLIYSANTAVTLTIEIDLNQIPEEKNHAKTALIVSIGNLHSAVTELIEEVHNETVLVKNEGSEFAFGESIISLVEEIFSAYTSYVLEKNETSEEVLREGCSKLTNNDTLAQLHTKAQDFAVQYLQDEHYTDEAFDMLDSAFSKIISQIALFYPQCYYLETSTNLDHETVEPVRNFIKNVVETFVEVNENRENDYWNETSVEGILEKHLSKNGNFKEIAKNIAKEFEENYQSINEKYDHKYSVIVYNDVNGFNKHSVSGNEYRFKFHFNGKNVVVLRGHAISKPYCEALETIDYKDLSGCSKDLRVTSNKVLERCPNINNALFITLDAKPETYPDDDKNQLLGYKKASMKGCVLVKDRALFFSYN